MAFKQNLERFRNRDNLLMVGVWLTLGAVMGFFSIGSVSYMYIWGTLLYCGLILFTPEKVSKTCFDKRIFYFSLCVIGVMILNMVREDML